jgi:hypothetical protein
VLNVTVACAWACLVASECRFRVSRGTMRRCTETVRKDCHPQTRPSELGTNTSRRTRPLIQCPVTPVNRSPQPPSFDPTSVHAWQQPMETRLRNEQPVKRLRCRINSVGMNESTRKSMPHSDLWSSLAIGPRAPLAQGLQRHLRIGWIQLGWF